MSKIKDKGLVQISVYLPIDIAEQLTNYCTNNEIVRKNKQGEITPALGTGILDIVKLFFNSDSRVQTNVLLPDQGTLESLNSTLISTLENRVQLRLIDYFNERIGQLNETLKACYSQTIDNRLAPIELKLQELINGNLDVCDRTQELPPRESSEYPQSPQSGIPSVPSESSGDCTNEVELITDDSVIDSGDRTDKLPPSQPLKVENSYEPELTTPDEIMQMHIDQAVKRIKKMTIETVAPFSTRRLIEVLKRENISCYYNGKDHTWDYKTLQKFTELNGLKFSDRTQEGILVLPEKTSDNLEGRFEEETYSSDVLCAIANDENNPLLPELGAQITDSASLETVISDGQVLLELDNGLGDTSVKDTIKVTSPTSDLVTANSIYDVSYSKIKELLSSQLDEIEKGTRTKISFSGIYNVLHNGKDDKLYPNYPNKQSKQQIHYKWNVSSFKDFLVNYESTNNITDNSIYTKLFPDNK